MRNVVKKEDITYTCNECWKVYNTATTAIEEIDDVWLILYEKYKEGYQNYLARNLQGRKLLDFCSKECCAHYLRKKVDMFVRELTPPKWPTKGVFFKK